MNISIGTNAFSGSIIPLLWGTRAILMDRKGRLSIIDLAGKEASLEILGDFPSPGIPYYPNPDGFTVKSQDKDLYHYNPTEKKVVSLGVGDLPDCAVHSDYIQVGEHIFSNNPARGTAVGLYVSERGIVLGAHVPPHLARLKI